MVPASSEQTFCQKLLFLEAGLGLAGHHFCQILLVKAVTDQPDSKGMGGQAPALDERMVCSVRKGLGDSILETRDPVT